MKNRNKKENLNEKEDFFHSVKSSVITALTYSVFALGIYAVITFSWWTGLVLFSAFAIFVLIRFIFTGITLIIGLIVAIISFLFIRRNGLNPRNFEKVLKNNQGIAWLTILMGLTEIYLFLIMLLLGGFLIFG